MGLTIVSITIYDGLAVINDLYANIRDIRTTKEEGKYIIEFSLLISKNNKNIQANFIRDSSDTPFLTIWSDAYTLAKQWLSNNNIEYIDEI